MSGSVSDEEATHFITDDNVGDDAAWVEYNSQRTGLQRRKRRNAVNLSFSSANTVQNTVQSMRLSCAEVEYLPYDIIDLNDSMVTEEENVDVLPSVQEDIVIVEQQEEAEPHLQAEPTFIEEVTQLHKDTLSDHIPEYATPIEPPVVDVVMKQPFSRNVHTKQGNGLNFYFENPLHSVVRGKTEIPLALEDAVTLSDGTVLLQIAQQLVVQNISEKRRFLPFPQPLQGSTVFERDTPTQTSHIIIQQQSDKVYIDCVENANRDVFVTDKQIMQQIDKKEQSAQNIPLCMDEGSNSGTEECVSLVYEFDKLDSITDVKYALTSTGTPLRSVGVIVEEETNKQLQPYVTIQQMIQSQAVMLTGQQYGYTQPLQFPALFTEEFSITKVIPLAASMSSFVAIASKGLVIFHSLSGVYLPTVLIPMMGITAVCQHRTFIDTLYVLSAGGAMSIVSLVTKKVEKTIFLHTKFQVLVPSTIVTSNATTSERITGVSVVTSTPCDFTKVASLEQSPCLLYLSVHTPERWYVQSLVNEVVCEVIFPVFKHMSNLITLDSQHTVSLATVAELSNERTAETQEYTIDTHILTQPTFQSAIDSFVHTIQGCLSTSCEVCDRLVSVQSRRSRFRMGIIGTARTLARFLFLFEIDVIQSLDLITCELRVCKAGQPTESIHKSVLGYSDIHQTFFITHQQQRSMCFVGYSNMKPAAHANVSTNTLPVTLQSHISAHGGQRTGQLDIIDVKKWFLFLSLNAIPLTQQHGVVELLNEMTYDQATMDCIFSYSHAAITTWPASIRILRCSRQQHLVHLNLALDTYSRRHSVLSSRKSTTLLPTNMLGGNSIALYKLHTPSYMHCYYLVMSALFNQEASNQSNQNKYNNVKKGQLSQTHTNVVIVNTNIQPTDNSTSTTTNTNAQEHTNTSNVYKAPAGIVATRSGNHRVISTNTKISKLLGITSDNQYINATLPPPSLVSLEEQHLEANARLASMYGVFDYPSDFVLMQHLYESRMTALQQELDASRMLTRDLQRECDTHVSVLRTLSGEVSSLDVQHNDAVLLLSEDISKKLKKLKQQRNKHHSLANKAKATTGSTKKVEDDVVMINNVLFHTKYNPAKSPLVSPRSNKSSDTQGMEALHQNTDVPKLTTRIVHPLRATQAPLFTSIQLREQQQSMDFPSFQTHLTTAVAQTKEQELSLLLGLHNLVNEPADNIDTCAQCGEIVLHRETIRQILQNTRTKHLPLVIQFIESLLDIVLCRCLVESILPERVYHMQDQHLLASPQ